MGVGAVMLSVELAGFVGVMVADTVLSSAVTPEVSARKSKKPVKPFRLPKEIVDIAEWPRFTSTCGGCAEMVKSGPVTGPSTVMVMNTEWDTHPNPV